MRDRREFPPSVYRTIVDRSRDVHGVICCEHCGLRLGKKRFAVDHTRAEALNRDKGRPLTAADGRLLGEDCCHKPKTAAEIAIITKADAQGGIERRPPRRSKRHLPGSKASGWKHCMSGGWERRP